MQHHPPTLEAFTCMTKKSCSSKNSTQFNSLPSDLIHIVDMWHLGIVYYNKFKLVLPQPTQQNPVFHASTSYKLKYDPFDYYMHCNVIQYAWADQWLGRHTSDRDREEEISHTIKHDPVSCHMTIQDRSRSHHLKSAHISLQHNLPKNDVPTYTHFSVHLTLFIQPFSDFHIS